MENEKNFFGMDFMTDSNVQMVNPQSLAFVGDAVYSLFIRSHFCLVSTARSRSLHKFSTDFVKATAQSKALDDIYDSLTEEEQGVAKRARNTKVNTMSKNAKMIEYKKSTAFEALLGYLYLCGKIERLNEILNLAVKNFGEE
jgi:ribonuclease-3 family protein